MPSHCRKSDGHFDLSSTLGWIITAVGIPATKVVDEEVTNCTSVTTHLSSTPKPLVFHIEWSIISITSPYSYNRFGRGEKKNIGNDGYSIVMQMEDDYSVTTHLCRFK